MKKYTWLLMLLTYQLSYGNGLPPGLVKVNKANDPSCVDYVNYQHELYCSTKPISPSLPISQALISQEKQQIQFDDRPWHAVWGKTEQGQFSLEYVVLGDNINHWHELVTSQFFPGLQGVSPKAFIQFFIDNLHKEGLTPVITLINSKPNEILFEFRITNPANMVQDELQKIVKTPEGFYILHYVIKKPDMGKENREKWIKNLNSSFIIK